MSDQARAVTCLLEEWSAGDPEALDQLMPLVLDQVRDLAARALARESPAHTLQPTALVNEVYLRLAGRRSVQWKNREQFFGFLADLMRRILVDHARRHQASKRGGDIANPPGGLPFLMAVTVLPAAVAGFLLGKRLHRDAAPVPSPRTRALRGLFAGAILTALAYTLGITGSAAITFVVRGRFSARAFTDAFEMVQEVLGEGIVEVLIGLPFGALAGMAFYLLAGKRTAEPPGIDPADTVS